MVLKMFLRFYSQKRLAEVAKNDKNWKVRCAAVKRLTDKNVVGYVAMTDEDDRVCQAANGQAVKLGMSSSDILACSPMFASVIRFK